MIPPIDSIHYAFIGGIGVPELLIIFVIIIVLFGANRIPKLARGLGKGITEFKQGLKDPTKNEDDEDSVKEIEDDTLKDKKEE